MPVDVDRLRAAVAGDVHVVSVLPTTGSTNDDAAMWAASAGVGAPHTTGHHVAAAFVADHQSGGRGRRGRSWTAPPGTSVAVSLVVRPAVPPTTWGWLPLLAGQAVRDAVAAVAAPLDPGVRVLVKWPNDVIITGAGEADGKLAGVLCEVRGMDVVVGAGLNTAFGAVERPVPGATSVCLVARHDIDATDAVAAYLTAFASWWRSWTTAGGDADRCGLRAAHLGNSATVGAMVRVSVPGGAVVTGQASSVDGGGRLVVSTSDGPVSLSAGDVVHVRPAPSPAASRE